MQGSPLATVNRRGEIKKSILREIKPERMGIVPPLLHPDYFFGYV